MSQKTAFITGITGQDGSYLAELLLAKNYQVHGLVRRSSSSNTARIQHLLGAEGASDGLLTLHHGDMTDTTALTRLVEEIRPDEVYNLAAQSHVGVSFDAADYTANVDGLGTLRLLEALRTAGLIKTSRFYQASTSELYGLVQETPQRETTPFYPRSPYAVAKLYAYWIVRNYREAHGLHGSNGILFNHESPRRGEMFVTRKITLAVGRIARGSRQPLQLGNLDASRDWGHARDFVEGMHLIIQQPKPDDYVLATGETHTVIDFELTRSTPIYDPFAFLLWIINDVQARTLDSYQRNVFEKIGLGGANRVDWKFYPDRTVLAEAGLDPEFIDDAFTSNDWSRFLEKWHARFLSLTREGHDA